MANARKNIGKDDLTTLLGENVRAHRLKRKMNQRAFSAFLGIHQSQLSAIELGKHCFTAETLENLAKALKIPPASLLAARKSATAS